jgi:putative glutamine amidotransferase
MVECGSFDPAGGEMAETLIPWIGMPAQMDPGGDREYLSRQYPDAIEAAGGMPMILPLAASAASVLPLAERLDGILLTGSNSDLDPARYGAVRLEACGPAQPLRDPMDFFLLETALRRRIPVLAICFGIQSLNVFLGGTLIQDIPTLVGGPIRHDVPETNGNPCHTIRISAGSILEEIAASREIGVNSTHHQAIERPGKDLSVIARAPDGVIESVIHRDPAQYILGVQWHPEKSFGFDMFSRRLFEGFIARCRAVRGMDERTDT